MATTKARRSEMFLLFGKTSQHENIFIIVVVVVVVVVGVFMMRCFHCESDKRAGPG